jgi:hypothetical protein
LPTVSPDGEVSFPGTVVFVDCETQSTQARANPGNQELRLWFGFASAGRIENGQLTRRKQVRFDSAKLFWDWLSMVRRPGSPVWLFAHNLNFDLTVLGFWDQLTAQTWKLSRERPLSPSTCAKRGLPNGSTSTDSGVLICEDPPSAVLCWHATGWRLNCLDTMNYWPTGLSKLGAAVGLEKLERPPLDAPREDWDRYCERDVRIIETAVCQFATWWKTQELGRFPLTISGAALKDRMPRGEDGSALGWDFGSQVPAVCGPSRSANHDRRPGAKGSLSSCRFEFVLRLG